MKKFALKLALILIILMVCTPMAVGIALAAHYDNYMFLLYGIITLVIITFTCVDIKLDKEEVY